MSAAVTLNEFGVLELEDPAQNHMSSVQKEVPQIWRNERIQIVEANGEKIVQLRVKAEIFSRDRV